MGYSPQGHKDTTERPEMGPAHPELEVLSPKPLDHHGRPVHFFLKVR